MELFTILVMLFIGALFTPYAIQTSIAAVKSVIREIKKQIKTDKYE